MSIQERIAATPIGGVLKLNPQDYKLFCELMLIDKVAAKQSLYGRTVICDIDKFYELDESIPIS